MPTYVVLGRLTDQGISNIKDTTKRWRDNIARAQAGGISVKGAYLTMGEYDAVLVLEAPDEQTALGGLMSLSSQGNLRTTTLRAFTMEEVQPVVDKLP